MQKKTLISVVDKTGFFGLGNVEIFDDEHKEFYNHRPQDGFFNLPNGRYFTNSRIFRTIKPISYQLPVLPEPDRNIEVTPKVIIEANPNTASIYLDEGKIIIDSTKWNSFGKLQKDFVLLHELAHLKYESEENADKWAMREMLKIGYNPSQIFQAIAKTLKPNMVNYNRCRHVYNLAKKAK